MIDKRNSLTKHSTKNYTHRKSSDINSIAIHHSATTSGSAEAFARYHVGTLGWPGIGYHYVINKDGTIDQCHDDLVISYHVGNSNKYAIGICLVGDFRTQQISDVQRNAALKLTRTLMKKYNLSENDVKGHFEYPNYDWKPCPSIDMKAFRNDLIEITERADKFAHEAQKWVIQNNISDGTKPRDQVTRQELWVMLHRLSNK